MTANHSKETCEEPGTLDYFQALVAAPSRLDEAQQAQVAQLEADLAEHMASKPRRLAHSLSVGHTAEADRKSVV